MSALQVTCRMVLPFAAVSVDHARRWLDALLVLNEIDRGDRENATMVLHELASNAVDHGADQNGTFQVGWELARNQLTVRVVDGGSAGDLVVRRPDQDAERGRGLLLVDAFSDGWQVDRGLTDTRVTAWLALR